MKFPNLANTTSIAACSILALGQCAGDKMKHAKHNKKNPAIIDGDVIVGGDDAQYGLRWYPKAQFDPNADDGQGKSWRRCGSGASVSHDQ